MIIDVIENKIIISNHVLISHQISQLKFWGFVSASLNTLIFSGQNPEKFLVKTVNYLIKESVKFETSADCQKILSLIFEKNNIFQEIKELGLTFKNGHFDETRFKEFNKFLEKHLPTRKLKPHQVKAAFHLYLIHNGANFSVPGSGKTSVVLSVYEKLKFEDKVNVLFIIGPPACFGPWKFEFIETLGRTPSYKILAGGDKTTRKGEYFANITNKAELYLTTYQTLINDQKEINIFFSQKGINVFLVIDEAHYIKQVNGNWSSAVLNIAKNSKFRCILTGTPIPKSFSDVYNLFDFLWPDNEPIDSNSRIRLQKLENGNQIDEAKIILDSKVGPLFYRVRKKDLGLKPAIFNDPIILQMNKYEKIIYDAIDKKIRNYSLDDYLLNIDLVNKLKRGRMIRLRQCVSYMHLLSNVIENYDEDILEDSKDLRNIIQNYDELEIPAKILYLKSMLQQFKEQGKKAVIWTNFVGTIEKLEKYFNEDLGLYARSIYGKTPIEQTSISDEKTREQIRDEFVDPTSGLDILIANPAACAESISLHKTCQNAIYYDLTYNCAQYLQSLDRIHRVGGSELLEANYFFLQYENSIDQDILSNLNKKSDRMKRIIDQDYEIYSLDMFDDDDDEVKAYDRLFGTK